MSKISGLPVITTPDGTELVVVSRAGVTYTVPLADLAPPASNVPFRPGMSVGQALDQLLYVAPVIAGFVATPAVAEVGASVANVALAWALNKAVTGQTIDGAAIAAAARAAAPAGPFVADRDWVLAVSDGTSIVSATASLRFRSKAYWGVLDTQMPSDVQLRGLTQAFATERSRAVTYDASAGGYPIYAWPAALGDLAGATVGGLGFSDYAVTTRAVVNASGASVSYHIAVFNGRQTGASIGVSWA